MRKFFEFIWDRVEILILILSAVLCGIGFLVFNFIDERIGRAIIFYSICAATGSGYFAIIFFLTGTYKQL